MKVPQTRICDDAGIYPRVADFLERCGPDGASAQQIREAFNVGNVARLLNEMRRVHGYGIRRLWRTEHDALGRQRFVCFHALANRPGQPPSGIDPQAT